MKDDQTSRLEYGQDAGYIQTRHGIKFHLHDPKPEDFNIKDIAHSLAHQCRFAGHTSEFYSVAEHSVRVCKLIQNVAPTWYTSGVFGPNCEKFADMAFAGLMHDASEAYLTDLARPFKYLPEFAWYRKAEDRLMREIAGVFEFHYPLPTVVKWADEVLLGTEARDLMAPVIDGWHFRYSHLPERIRPWSPRKAKREFLDHFYRLNPQGLTGLTGKTGRTFFGFLFGD